ncbi:MAG: hypothetical protein DBX52_07975 [Clostridiales bacterium]|nr:MAG: hypothetical protein DBX52_07975 [Clostridiales bacterium]
MKKWTAIFMAAVLLLCSGCNFKVQKDSFSIPQEMVKGIEFQREYFNEEGTAYFRRKLVSNQTDIEEICTMIRTLSVERASRNEPHPITDFPLIIILRGDKDHHLILTEDMAFYDQIPYVYKDKKIFETFKTLYDNLDYEEEDTEPERF